MTIGKYNSESQNWAKIPQIKDWGKKTRFNWVDFDCILEGTLGTHPESPQFKTKFAV